MNGKELVTIGVVAAGGIGVLVFAASQKTTTTSTSVDPSAAATENNIIAASTTAQNTQASENVSLASIDAQETVGLAQLATTYETTHDNNQTALAVGAQNGATNVALNTIAANATYQSALLDTVAKLESTLSTAQTSQYASYVTGQTALAADAATTSQVGLTTAATQAIAAAQGVTQVDVASIAGATTQNVAQTQANAATQISANQTTASVNAANQAASTAKSNGVWSALSNIAGSIARAFVPSVGGASSGTAATPTPTAANSPGSMFASVQVA